MELFELNFYGLKRFLPLTFISASKKIANFNILGDIEFTDKAGEQLEKLLSSKNLTPDCFVAPSVDIIPLVHDLAKRFGHDRYVILEKSIRGYMVTPEIKHPWRSAPKHAKNLVLNGPDREYLQDKKVILLDSVVSTGTTIQMLSELMEQIGINVLAKCAIFKQGDKDFPGLLYLANLPILSPK